MHNRLAPVVECEDDQTSLAGILQFVGNLIMKGIVEGLISKIKTAIKRSWR